MKKQEKISLLNKLFDTMIVLDNVVDDHCKLIICDVPGKVDKKYKSILANKKRYESVAHRFSNKGLVWWLVAVIHEMEGEQNFNTYLGNGEQLRFVTKMVPKGRGPFKNFEDGAFDALTLAKMNDVTDWSIGNVLYILEKYNGFGYDKFGGISPYLWSGSQHYKKGKYVEDGVYDPSYVSRQIGIALLLKKILSV